MEAMLFDDRDSLNSDEDWGAFHEHEAAMMQILNPDGSESLPKGMKKKKKGCKKKKMPVHHGGYEDAFMSKADRGGFGARGRGGFSYTSPYYNQFSYDGSERDTGYRIPGSGLFGGPNAKSGLFETQAIGSKKSLAFDSYVLPKEKISVAIETKKIYAFSANGSLKIIKTILELIK